MSSGSRHATWIGLMAPTFDRAGAPVALPPGAAMRVFLVPATAVAFIENWNVIGLIATNSGGFKVEDVLVPHGHSVYLPFPRSPATAGPLSRFPLNNLFGIGFTGVALGTARAMMDIVIALAQPLLGILGDRKQMRWLVYVGCLLTGVGMVAVMFLPSYWLIVAAVMLSGLGSAMFHPEALSVVRAVSGQKSASASSVFFSPYARTVEGTPSAFT